MQSFASQLKQSNFHSIVTHELFFPPVFHLFLWQGVVKGYLRDRNPVNKKFSRETERKETKNVLFQQNARKWITRKEKESWLLRNKSRENKRRNFHRRLKKYFKEQLCTFLERNGYSRIISIKNMCWLLCFDQYPTRMRHVLLRSEW